MTIIFEQKHIPVFATNADPKEVEAMVGVGMHSVSGRANR